MTALAYSTEHLDFRRSVAILCDRIDAQASALGPAGEAGFLGVQVPEDLGGAGVDDPLFLAIGVEEFCQRGQIGAALGYAVQAGVVLPTVVAHANRDLAVDVVPSLAAGTACAGLVVSGVEAIRTDDGWNLSGRARTVVNAEGARHLLVVFDDQGEQRVGLVGVNELGLEIVEKEARALGGASIAEVSLDHVPLKLSRALAIQAYAHVVASLRLWISVVALHGARRALDLTTTYVSERKVFGRSLSGFDNTRNVVGRVAADLTQAQRVVEWGLLRSAAGDLSAVEAAPLLLSATRAFHEAADAGLQLHGGYGYMREYPISGTFADAQLLLLLGGVIDPLADLAEAILGNVAN